MLQVAPAGLILRSATTATTAATSATTATTAAAIVAVSSVHATLTKGFHVLALLLTTPLTTTRLLPVGCSVLGLARDVVEERSRLVVYGGSGVRAIGFLDLGTFGFFARLLNLILVELLVCFGKVKV